MKTVPVNKDSVVLITISGQARTGKDKFCSGLEALLREDNRVAVFSSALADILKTNASEVFNVPEYIFRDDQIKDSILKTDRSAALHPIDLGFLSCADEEFLRTTTPRQLLLKLGAIYESFRKDGNTLCHLWWLTNEPTISQYSLGKLPIVIVPDVRLPREANYFKDSFIRRHSILLDYSSSKVISAAKDKTETQVKDIERRYFDSIVPASKTEYSQDHPSVIKVYEEIKDTLL